ncbi:hypothetical protein [Marispirochaeta aestuarii]|uniref:hypothetical protein n=1 Tax=Marispirochaeta aestuarii TaxID=1963862 RepID=UPI002ABD16A3|nr:hypothetical protein [Marispirochaeta aestuarii]
MLSASGLDYFRLVGKLNQLLEAKKVVHYQGEEVGVYEDGIVQEKATELLAELLGVRKGQLDINLPPNAYGVLVAPGVSPDPDDWAERARQQQSKQHGEDDQE